MSSPNRYGSNRTKAQQVSEQSGYNGGVYISNTAKVDRNFTKVKALAATVIAAMENADIGPNLEGTLTAIPLPVNGEITGNFKSITLTSGTVVISF